MRTLLLLLVHGVRDLLRSRRSLHLELLALRHQVAVYERTIKRPRTRATDRLLWSWLSRSWKEWERVVSFVQPSTVIRWRRRKFREYWWARSGRGPGRPRVSREVQDLIRRLSAANPSWGAVRIRGELKKIGVDVAKSTVDTYRVRPRRPPSPSWKTFLRTHVQDLVSIDFFVVPTIRNRVLYVFLVLDVARRQVVHYNVTARPTAAWTAQQVVEAYPWDPPPRYLLRDNDKLYRAGFGRRVQGLGFEEIRTALRCPWQNPYVERLIGSVRRECLDHLLVINEMHLKRILRAYFTYYNRWRTHQALDLDAPEPREVHPVDRGPVVAIPEIGGLHHHYERRAA